MPKKSIRHTYSPADKAAWAIEVLKGEKTLAQLSSESGVHVNQLRQWRDALVAHAGDLFTSDKPVLRQLAEAHEKEKRELYAEIGSLAAGQRAHHPGELVEKKSWWAILALNGSP